MTIDALHAWLVTHGYADWIRRAGDRISLFDFYLDRESDLYRVYIIERGVMIALCLETNSEARACAYFVEQVTGSFLVYAGNDPADAADVQARLACDGIVVRTNDMPPFTAADEGRFRIFVSGSDLALARQLLEQAHPHK